MAMMGHTRQRILRAIFAVGIGLSSAPSASAQVQVRDFTIPMVVLGTGGHSAPVRQLLFVPNSPLLLSAGQDKIVQVWNLRGGRQDLVGTIRPPIWRGPAGVIYAMALSPPLPRDGNRRLLALAGVGVEANRGNIALYRLPGAGGPPTGEMVAQLPSGTAGPTGRPGHVRPVAALAFTPDGRFLVSGGLDGRALLWDLRNRSVAGEFVGHHAGIRCLGISPDGRNLFTGGVEGIVRQFDLATRALLRQVNPPPRRNADAQSLTIHALATGARDPRWLVFGREDGRVFRLDAQNLGNLAEMDTSTTRGPVAALALSHDGNSLAASLVMRALTRPGDLPDAEGVVELRRMPDGAILQRIATTTGPSRAIAFNQDDSVLAFSGRPSTFGPNDPYRETQGITLKDLRDPRRPLVEIKGRGSSLFEVGFTPSSRSIAFLRQRLDRPGESPAFEAFELQGRMIRDAVQAGLSRGRATLDGWWVRSVDPLTLDALNVRGQGFRLRLDPERDGRWWCWSFLPAGPGHPSPTLAVGCEGGVEIFSLATGKATRALAGHSGRVLSLAPSPDGRWLVTGSADQTARLWPLSGCDSPDPLGATFDRVPDGAWTVAKVEASSFADRMGLRVADVVERCGSGEAEAKDKEAFFKGIADVPPGVLIEFLVRRGDQRIGLNTTRRRSPALSFFPGVDGEWVLWMPEGYYETSAAGDKEYLGWHRNGVWGANPPAPTEFFPAEKFEAELRKPAILDRLVETADPIQAVAVVAPPAPAALPRAPSEVVASDGPPEIRLIAPAPEPSGGPIVLRGEDFSFRTVVSAKGRSPVRLLRLQLEGQPVEPAISFDPPVPEIDRELKLKVPSGQYRVSVVAVNDRGKARIEGLDVENPRPPARPPRLVVLAVGVSRFAQKALPTIRFADADAIDARSFLVKWGRGGFSRIDSPPALSDETATGESILDAFLTLERSGLGPGDAIVAVLESHMLAHDKGHLIVGYDSGPGLPPRGAVSADDVGACLGRVAASGCRVILLVDGRHESTPGDWDSHLGEWVREVSRQSVIVFLASNHGPSRRRLGHGAFTQALLDVNTARGQARPWVDPKDRFSLDDFQITVVQRVLELTGRQQNAFCYVPETLSPHLPFLDARPTHLGRADTGEPQGR